MDIVKVKTLYDKSIKFYRIDDDMLLKQGMYFVGTTRFGNDIVQIHCPKREEYTSNEWGDILSSMGCSEDKANRFAFEPLLLHPAKDSEISRYQQNNKESSELMPLFKQKILEYNLDMKVVELHFTLDRERLVCTYTADSRVDFRDLVKDLGSQLKQRIEMYQISAREAISQLDTCGSCGRQLCCQIGCVANFSDKKAYSGKSAKFLGVCGKSRCCSFFEEEEKSYIS